MCIIQITGEHSIRKLPNFNYDDLQNKVSAGDARNTI